MKKTLTAIVLSTLTTTAFAAEYVTTLEGCKAIAQGTQKGDCRITSLPADQAQQALQAFADSDPDTQVKYDRMKQEVRAASAFPAMGNLKRDEHACVTRGEDERTAFWSCGAAGNGK